jgi:uncharacterized protein YgfB (UPF0149 family)
VDKKIRAHLDSLTKSELKARAHKMSDIIDDLEEMSEFVDDDDLETLERAILEIRELRLRISSLESKLR